MGIMELVTEIIAICTLIGIIIGAVKFVVIPILDLQKSMAKIEIILVQVRQENLHNNESISKNNECIDEVKTMIEEHESRLDVIDKTLEFLEKKGGKL